MIPATMPIAINEPILSIVPAIGPHIIAPPIMPKWIYLRPNLFFKPAVMNMFVKTDEQSANTMFIKPSVQMYLVLSDFTGKKLLIPIKVRKSKNVPIKEVIRGSSLLLICPFYTL